MPSSQPRVSVWPFVAFGVLALIAYARQGAVRWHRGAVPEGTGPATGAFGSVRSTDEPASLQQERSLEVGRGRRAKSPWRIPWAGWKDIFWRTFNEIMSDRLLAVAAGVVFYSLLAVFPALSALVSLYGLFAAPGTVIDHLIFFEQVLPPGAFDIVREQVERIAAGSGGGLTFTFLISLGLALWSANAAAKAIFDALNVIYDEDERRGFVRLNLVSLTFTLGGILFFLLAVAGIVVLPLVFDWLGLVGVGPGLISALRWPGLFLVMLLGLGILYRFGPNRVGARWQWVSVGALFATVAWLAASFAFSWYLQNFANYGATYGSLGAVIGLMMWMWLSAIVVLVGAELNAEIEHQTARDSTVGPEKPLGARGAAMADTVGAAAE